MRADMAALKEAIDRLAAVRDAMLPSKERNTLEQRYETWLRSLFPRTFSNANGPVPFSEAHKEYWSRVWQWEAGVRPDPEVLILSRGGGKSTVTEVTGIMVGARELRMYCLYISGTQEQADKHVEAIASRLESARVAEVYPMLGQRRLGKFGNQRGWRRNRLSCANGFTVEGIGLDVSSRGIKIDDYRPGMMIFDDVDDRRDSIEQAKRKAETITNDILPAGSDDCAVAFVQNVIHYNSVCAALAGLASWRADFLSTRHVVGPVPALRDFRWETDQETGRTYILGGIPTWEGQGLKKCQEQINDWGPTAFRREAQHEDIEVGGGMFQDTVFPHVSADEMPDLVFTEVWCDPAVSDTDESDANGIQADAKGSDGKIYRLFSWEYRSGPSDTLRLAIEVAIRLGARALGVETDQGGDLWADEYRHVWKEMVEDGTLELLADELELERIRKPAFKSAKAGSIGGKGHRASLMQTAYERGEIRHVDDDVIEVVYRTSASNPGGAKVVRHSGSAAKLEASLRRYLAHKPYDLGDAAFWSWYSVSGRLEKEGKKKSAPGLIASAVADGSGWSTGRPAGNAAPKVPRRHALVV